MKNIITLTLLICSQLAYAEESETYKVPLVQLDNTLASMTVDVDPSKEEMLYEVCINVDVDELYAVTKCLVSTWTGDRVIKFMYRKAEDVVN